MMILKIGDTVRITKFGHSLKGAIGKIAGMNDKDGNILYNIKISDGSHYKFLRHNIEPYCGMEQLDPHTLKVNDKVRVRDIRSIYNGKEGKIYNILGNRDGQKVYYVEFSPTNRSQYLIQELEFVEQKTMVQIAAEYKKNVEELEMTSKAEENIRKNLKNNLQKQSELKTKIEDLQTELLKEAIK